MTPRDSAGVSRASSRRPPGDFFTEWQQCEGEAAESGGDWYDIISLGDVALVIDDVVDHGAEAAPTMAKQDDIALLAVRMHRPRGDGRSYDRRPAGGKGQP